MCGGNDLIKQDGVFVCQHCNSKYSVEEAKKMIVTIDNSDKFESALKNANRAMNEGDYGQAEKYYNIAKMIEPENWEANFFCVFSKVAQEKVPNVDVSPIRRSIKNIFNDIKKLDNTTKQNEAIELISTMLSTCAMAASNVYKSNSYNFYDDISKCADSLLPFPRLLTFFGNELVSEFGENEFTDKINIQCHETALKIVKDLYNGTRFSNYCYRAIDIVKEYTDELGKIKALTYIDTQKGIVDTIIEYLPWIGMLTVFLLLLCAALI